MILAFLFALVAFFYASVGFGGGSSYLALLALWKVDYTLVPVISLICNIIVVSGNSFHYTRAGCVPKHLLCPLVIFSVPFAYLGGTIAIEKDSFFLLLCVTLSVTGIRLILNHNSYDNAARSYHTIAPWFSAVTGAALGFLAGIVGIGGGIFLAPFLYNARLGSPRQIATATSVFILVNSIAGLLGQLHKNGMTDAFLTYWYLPLFVFAAGQLGNLITVKLIPQRIVALATGLLTVFVAARLGWMLFR